MNQFPAILKNEKVDERSMNFRDALFSLDKNAVTTDNYSDLIRIYSCAKESGIRMKILKLLYDFDFPALQLFFSVAYKRERGLGMKIYALRGLSKFISEAEIGKLLEKFNQILSKRQINTPYNNIEYEYLRGQNALPYLVNKYNYKCFTDTLMQVDKQYDEMPGAFKGHFTIDKNGELIHLISPDESKRITQEFFEKKRKKL